MNERIDELISQTPLRYNMHQSKAERTEELEKFAELIVLECANIAKVDSDFYARYIGDATMSAKADVLALCSHHIKDHFGVE